MEDNNTICALLTDSYVIYEIHDIDIICALYKVTYLATILNMLKPMIILQKFLLESGLTEEEFTIY